jgi:hypothetical protein
VSEVRPVVASDFEAVWPVLARFANPRMSRDDWRGMLFDLPWPTDEPLRGYALWDGPTVVGFLGAIPSTRAIGGRARRFVNLSSWIVAEAYRSESLKLAFAAVSDRARTVVNLSPSETAWPVFDKLGFRTLESEQVLAPALGRVHEWWPGGGARAVADPGPGSSAAAETFVRGLPTEVAALWRDHRGTRARAVRLEADGRVALAVAVRSAWKGARTLAHVHYATDWDLLWRHPGRVARAFGRALGTSGLRVDGRFAPAAGALPPFAVRRALPRTNLYRPEDDTITPALVDGLYTEAVGQVF